MTFGQKLRKRRIAMDITQKQLARMIDKKLTSVAISNWECDRCYPNVEHLLKLVLIMELSLNYMFSDELYSVNPIGYRKVINHE